MFIASSSTTTSLIAWSSVAPAPRPRPMHTACCQFISPIESGEICLLEAEYGENETIIREYPRSSSLLVFWCGSSGTPFSVEEEWSQGLAE